MRQLLESAAEKDTPEEKSDQQQWTCCEYIQRKLNVHEIMFFSVSLTQDSTDYSARDQLKQK